MSSTRISFHCVFALYFFSNIRIVRSPVITNQSIEILDRNAVLIFVHQVGFFGTSMLG